MLNETRVKGRVVGDLKLNIYHVYTILDRKFIKHWDLLKNVLMVVEIDTKRISKKLYFCGL